jgi:hypothetical protein
METVDKNKDKVIAVSKVFSLFINETLHIFGNHNLITFLQKQHFSRGVCEYREIKFENSFNYNYGLINFGLQTKIKWFLRII